MRSAFIYGIICLAAAQAAFAQEETPLAPAAPASHAAKSSPSGEKHDTKLPIEINSDTLEVLQHENKAIFKGNVVAVQGDVRLKSDVMVVHYKQHNQPGAPGSVPVAAPVAAPAPTTDASAKPEDVMPGGGVAQGSMGAITRIDVQGNVFVATPEESAKGDTGDYDVESHVIHLFGPRVILTRDKNILRGTALEYNLVTGRSLLTNNGTAVGGAPGRVRTVFVPNEDKTGTTKADPTPPAETPQN